MSRAFVLFQLQIDDADGYREYEAADHIAMLKKFDGTFIGADAAAEVLEGQWPYRTALVEFPSKELAHAWFESEDPGGGRASPPLSQVECGNYLRGLAVDQRAFLTGGDLVQNPGDESSSCATSS